MTYKERLLASEEEMNAATVEAKVSETQAEIESKVSALKARLVRQNNQKDQMLSHYPLNVESLRSKQAEISSTTSEIEDLESILEELFG